ncbi:MAG: alpha-mannosidase [Bacteroidetes bacterium]|nr:alpha-mannosidase [Bacteroidota bacterium]
MRTINFLKPVVFFFFLSFLMTFHLLVKGQILDQKKEYQLSFQAKNYVDGFSKKLKGEELNYSCVRDDVSEAFLTRATDGKMDIVWETKAVPSDWKGGSISFIWLSSYNLNAGDMPFDVYINDVLKFTFSDSKNENWKVASPDGGELSNVTLKHDIHNDAQGYTILTCPSSWITSGKSLKIRITGRAKSSNAWYMVFKAADVVSYLNEIYQYKGWYNLTFDQTAKNKLKITVAAPAYLIGSKKNFALDRRKGELVFKENGDESIATSEVIGSFKAKYFTFFSDNKKIFVIDPFNTEYNKSELHSKSMVQVVTAKNGDTFTASVKLSYTPSLQTNLFGLSGSPMNKGKILLMNSSHQDIAWMDSPEKCIIERDTMLLAPLFNQAAKNPGYRFDIEDVLMVREFIGRHPERKAELSKFLKDGIFSCGSTYQMPYEEMYSGESLLRQFYLGARWLKKEMDGYQAVTYWNVDVPGRTLQMPQIMKKSGTKYLVLSRQEKGIFNWYSPDSSYVTTYSPGHYGDDYGSLNKEMNAAADYVAKSALSWIKKPSYAVAKGKDPVVPLLSDNDMSPAKDYSGLIDRWNSINSYLDEKGGLKQMQLPKLALTTSTQFLDEYTSVVKDLPSIKGERPAVWLYIHGPTHQKAIKASREGDNMITTAEKFSAIRAMIEKSFRNYPERRLETAWESKIYPDHGWGGKNGDITDALFESKYQFALSEAKQMTENALNGIASYINTDSKKGIPVVVFNSLSWKRSNPVTMDINFKEGEARNIQLVDADGGIVDAQMRKVGLHPDGSLKRASICFIAIDVPSMGYKTFYVKPSDKPAVGLEKQIGKVAESDFYRVEFANGGIKQITDKENGTQLLETGKLLGGEVFTMKSVGTGAGEFSDIQHPTMEHFDKTSNYSSKWQLVERGPVYSAYKVRGPIRGAEVEETVIIYNHLKQIDFEVSLLNWTGEIYREFRFAMPLNMQKGQVVYEVPYGTVEVGKDEIAGAAGERYTTICKDIHPRGIMNWIGASNDHFGVTLSSSVAVADYIDPTDSLNHQTILQPLMMAARRSCHWEGNLYPQTGNHYFKFSLFSHAKGWLNGNDKGIEANNDLLTIVDPVKAQNASLKESLSFFDNANKNVIISTIKKCEDDETIVLRYYDISGKNGQLQMRTFIPCTEIQNTNMLEEVISSSLLKKVNSSVFLLPFTHQSIETCKLKFF